MLENYFIHLHIAYLLSYLGKAILQTNDYLLLCGFPISISNEKTQESIKHNYYSQHCAITRPQLLGNLNMRLFCIRLSHRLVFQVCQCHVI